MKMQPIELTLSYSNGFEKTEVRGQKLKKKKSEPTKLSTKHYHSIVANVEYNRSCGF